jgi:hypothetical protein
MSSLNKSLNCNSTTIDIAHAGRLIGISQATAYRWLASGKFEPRQGGHVTIESVEAHTGPLTKERIELARHAPRKRRVRHA